MKDFIHETSENLTQLNATNSRVANQLKSLIDKLKEKVLEFNRNLDFSKSIKLMNLIKKFRVFADLLGNKEAIDLIQNFNANILSDISNNQDVSINSLDDLVQNDLIGKYRTLSGSRELKEVKEQIDKKIVSLFNQELEKAERLDYDPASKLLNKCKNIAQNNLPIELKSNYIDLLIQNTEQVIESKLLDKQLIVTCKSQS